jgi:hypothetical protein
MKSLSALSALSILGLTACGSMNGPISSGDFDPLRPPGSNLNLSTSSEASFRPGQFVEASMDNTAFFKTRPKGDADADKLLTRGTSMKVAQSDGSYLKVELDDTGEVGWVPSVMVADPNAQPAGLPGAPGEFQIYPPLPGGDPGAITPLPLLDSAGQPPPGSIPAIIDPTAPIPTDPTAVPPLAPVEVPDTTTPVPAPSPAPAPGSTPATPPVTPPATPPTTEKTPAPKEKPAEPKVEAEITPPLGQ